jgi:hypothetical protein
VADVAVVTAGAELAAAAVNQRPPPSSAPPGSAPPVTVHLAVEALAALAGACARACFVLPEGGGGRPGMAAADVEKVFDWSLAARPIINDVRKNHRG